MKIAIRIKKALFCGTVILTGLSGQAYAQGAPAINAAVLPSSRTATVGAPTTVFGTIVNSGPGTATACSVGLKPDTANGGTNPVGLTVSYQAFEANNATPAAAANTPIDIAVGAAQAFVLSITGNGAFNQEIAFDFTCNAGAVTAPVFESVNTLLLLNSTTPSPDIITIGTSPTKDGIISIPTLGAGEIMAVAALNIGASTAPETPQGTSRPNAGNNPTPVVVVADFGNFDLALDTFICETDPNTAMCLAPFAREVRTTIGDAPSTFNVFVNSTLGAGVPLNADIARQFIRFYQDTTPPAPEKPGTSTPAALPPANSGSLFGATSHAVTSPGPAIGDFTNTPDGLWTIVYDSQAGIDVTTRDIGLVGISVEGEWTALIADTDFGDIFQFGFVTADKTTSPDPTMDIDIVAYEDNMNVPDDPQINRNYLGSGTWRPSTFMTGNISFTAPALDKPTTSGPAIFNGQPAGFRAVFDPLYNRSVSLSGFAGNYDFIDLDNGVSADIGDATLLANGSFTGTISPTPGELCTLTGTLTEYGNGKNLFGTDITLTNCAFADTFMGQGVQLDDDELTPGSITQDVLVLLVRGSNLSRAARLNLVPKGN